MIFTGDSGSVTSPFAHEGGRALGARGRQLDHLVAFRAVGVGEFQRRRDPGLLLLRRRLLRQLGRAFLVGQHGTRDLVHLGANALQFGLGTSADLAAAERRVQRKGELAVVQRGANAEIALRTRHQRLVKPGLVRGHRDAQVADRVRRVRGLPRPAARGSG